MDYAHLKELTLVSTLVLGLSLVELEFSVPSHKSSVTMKTQHSNVAH